MGFSFSMKDTSNAALLGYLRSHHNYVAYIQKPHWCWGSHDTYIGSSLDSGTQPQTWMIFTSPISSHSISRWMKLSQCDWVELVFHLFSGDIFNFGRLCRSNKRMIREDGTNQSDPRHFNESKDLQHKPISTAHWGGDPGKTIAVFDNEECITYQWLNCYRPVLELLKLKFVW